MTRFRRTILPTLTLLAFIHAAIVSAQPAPYESEAYDLHIVVPSGWSLGESVDPSGLLTLELYPPGGGGVVVVAVATIGDGDRAYWSSPRAQLLDDVWSGFQPEVPGSQVQRTYETEVLGLTAGVLDYASEHVAGTIVLLVGPSASYTFISAADGANLPIVQDGLEQVVNSLMPPSIRRGDHIMLPSEPTQPGEPGANPLDPPAPTPPGGDAPPVNPLDPTPPANPLDPAPPANPLGGGDAAAPASDPYVGTFANAQVELVLAASDAGYAGELVVQGTAYPVSASVVDGRLDGSFRAGDAEYAFEAVLEGDIVTLDSDGSRFVLQRRP